MTALPPSVVDPPPTLSSRSQPASRALLAQATTASRGLCAGHLVMHAGVARPQRLGDPPDRIGLAVERAPGEDEHPPGAEPLGRLGHSLGGRAAEHHAIHSREDDLARAHGRRGYILGECRGRAVEGMNASKLLRDRIRAGEHTTVTTGLAPGHLQANLVILPADWADEFAAFCAANPKPCPLIAQSAPGDPTLPGLGPDIDVRRDLPCYRVFRDGEAVSEETDISALWRDDLVAFALGCSYSFEGALLEAGVPIRHIEQDKKVCTYRTGLDTVPAGRLHGRMVVSMRNFTVPNAIRAIEITSRFPRVHGAPIHFGDPARDRHRRHRQAGIRRRARHPAGRGAAVLGLRRDPAGGDRGGPAAVLHHAQGRPHAGHRPIERGVPRGLR